MQVKTVFNTEILFVATEELSHYNECIKIVQKGVSGYE